MEIPARLKPGETVAGYRVLDKWHEGSMATLYRVNDAAGAECLLKVPKLGFGSHPACYAGFETEQAILERLSGPHVPVLHASGEDEHGPYLVIEHVAGTPLSDIAATAPLAATQVASVGSALADALHDIHRQDVVHHDLKPAHVVLRADGSAVLLDFGLACHGGLPDLAAAEGEGPLGTPAYLAPEQVLGVRGDPRSDIFAAGVMLYTLASGRLPYGESDSAWGRQRRRWFDPVPPRALNAAVPEWLQEIILRCLAVRPDRRYASAAQLAHDLAHPDQVVVGERGRRRRAGGMLLAARRWWAEFAPGARSRKAPAALLARAPHVLVAIDTDSADENLAAAMRLAVRRLIGDDPHWRVSCVGVLEPSLATEQEAAGELERAFHTRQLVALHHWALPLALPPHQARFHVLTGSDAASAIVAYARAAHADYIVMGARGSSGLRRFLGSVSARVVAEAPCSVTVVRAPRAG